MELKYKDIEKTLALAAAAKRDLTITVNEDGTFEIKFEIPNKTTATMVYEPNVRRNEG